ncbi:MAG: SDR family oxidoreductase [Planctomycetes bacterium]|nr:SDR family oxidoreductase [Planctomycetota bacterium]
MRVVVTGAAGFIGYHLCDRLLRDDHQVIGIDDLSTGQQRNLDALATRDAFTSVKQDISTSVAVDGPVDLIYNMACPASPVDFESKALHILDVCSRGTRNMLELAREKRASFLHASTSECYGDPREHPQKESYWGHVNPIGLRSPYDEGKRFAEALVMTFYRRFEVNTHLVRIFNTYGPRMRSGDGRLLPNLINQAIRGEPLTVYGDGRQTRSFCYVTDLVDGIVRLMAADFHEPVNVGSDEELTILEVAERIIEITESKSEIVFQPLPQDDPVRRRPDLSRAREVLGWAPTIKTSEGFRRTVEYFKTVAVR